MIKKMWAECDNDISNEKNEVLVLTYEKQTASQMKPVFVTDKDPFENVRAIKKLYQCSSCLGLNCTCAGCIVNEIGGRKSYLADLEVAIIEDMQISDKGAE